MNSLLMLNVLSELDTKVLLFLNSMHSDFSDQAMWIVTNKWIWIPMYASILYVLLRNLNWQMTIISVIAIVGVIVYSDQICASLLRPYFHRLRPSHIDSGISSLLHLVNGYRGGTYGLPSCHAANSFGLAFFIAFFFKNRLLTIFMLLWATLNSYSRIYTGVHYLSDLIAGMIVGLSGAILIYLCLNLLLKQKPIQTFAGISNLSMWSNKSISPILYSGAVMCIIISVYSICHIY